MNYGTGLSGFLGTHLAKKLDIIAIPHDKIQSIKLEPFDYFFFCSTYGNLASQTDDSEIFKANIEDLLRIVLQVKEMKFKCFVFISSSSVKLKYQTTYSRMKKAAEEILLAVMERYNLPICIIRPYSVTGVGEQEEHLIPTVIKSIKEGKVINLVPNATHDFIDVEDVVDGILNLSQNNARGVFELGTGVKTTNKEVVETVEKVLSKKAIVNEVSSMRAYDNDNWVSTNFRSRSFGWFPKKTVEQSVKEMYEAK